MRAKTDGLCCNVGKTGVGVMWRGLR